MGGSASRDDLLAAESASYHSPGTCTFYGTANSNQMLMEFMGLQLPGSSFVAPDSPLRRSLTRAAVERLVDITADKNEFTPLAHVVSEKTLVNGIIADKYDISFVGPNCLGLINTDPDIRINASFARKMLRKLAR